METIQTENGNTTITSEKELLEEFLNSLEIDSGQLTDIESITPEIRLNNFLWLIKQKEIELNRCRIIVEELTNRTNVWLNLKEQRINSAIQYLSNQMCNYLKLQNLKSLSLPNGTIGLKKQQDKIVIEDSEVFFANAKDELLRHVPEAYEADLKAIKDYIKRTSEIPKGIDLKPQESKFYYKISDD